jgi:hypothetical protein
MALPDSIPMNTSMVIVIPCFKEETWMETALSLLNCKETNSPVCVFWIVNCSDKSIHIQEEKKRAERMKQFFDECNNSLQKHFVSFEAFPDKFAGVGLARKVGMDKAAALLIQNKNQQGLIICLDADCKVQNNYLLAIEESMKQHPAAPGASIYFEHPLNGEFQEAILHYEYFLRYYRLALRWCGHPFAYHTIGSSMLVRADVYQKQGGMNKRKAGEDFYFLNKVIELGNFVEINSTCVFPSDRNSDRVPFGTGRSVQDFYSKKKEWFYDEKIFIYLKSFFNLVKEYREEKDFFSALSNEIREFLIQENLMNEIRKVYQHSSNKNSFIKRFFRMFNLFTVLKFVHWLSDSKHPRTSDTANTKWLFRELNINMDDSVKDNLLLLRAHERSV